MGASQCKISLYNILINMFLQYCLLFDTRFWINCSHRAPFSPGPKLEPGNFAFSIICVSTICSSKLFLVVHCLYRQLQILGNFCRGFPSISSNFGALSKSALKDFDKDSSPLGFPFGAREASGKTSIATLLLPTLCERGCWPSFPVWTANHNHCVDLFERLSFEEPALLFGKAFALGFQIVLHGLLVAILSAALM